MTKSRVIQLLLTSSLLSLSYTLSSALYLPFFFPSLFVFSARIRAFSLLLTTALVFSCMQLKAKVIYSHSNVRQTARLLNKMQKVFTGKNTNARNGEKWSLRSRDSTSLLQMQMRFSLFFFFLFFFFPFSCWLALLPSSRVCL